MLDIHTILRQAATVAAETIEGEAILIDTHSGSTYSLNKVGTEFWARLDGQASLGEHAVAIAGKYDVDALMVTDDMLELAGRLAAEALVEVV